LIRIALHDELCEILDVKLTSFTKNQPTIKHTQHKINNDQHISLQTSDDSKATLVFGENNEDEPT